MNRQYRCAQTLSLASFPTRSQTEEHYSPAHFTSASLNMFTRITCPTHTLKNWQTHIHTPKESLLTPILSAYQDNFSNVRTRYTISIPWLLPHLPLTVTTLLCEQMQSPEQGAFSQLAFTHFCNRLSTIPPTSNSQGYNSIYFYTASNNNDPLWAEPYDALQSFSVYSPFILLP